MLTIGQKVVYPSYGPCVIDAIVEKTFGASRATFYQLRVLVDGGGDLFVPLDKVQSVGMRPLLKRSQMPRLLARLGERTRSIDDHRQRAIENSKLLASGSALALAGIVESLTELARTKSLSINDRKALDRAKKLLVCEVSEVMGLSKEDAEARVNKALDGSAGQATATARA